MAAFVGMALYNQIEKDLKSFFNFLFRCFEGFFFSYLEFLGFFLPSSITKINVYFFNKKSSMYSLLHMMMLLEIFILNSFFSK